MKFIHAFVPLIFDFLCLSTRGQQAPPSWEDHFAGVNARGDAGMGFSHENTTHHFRLLADVGFQPVVFQKLSWRDRRDFNRVRTV